GRRAGSIGVRAARARLAGDRPLRRGGPRRPEHVSGRSLRGMYKARHRDGAAVSVGQSMYQVDRYVDVNTRGTALLLDILVNTKHKVEKVLVASSIGVYGEGAYRCATH